MFSTSGHFAHWNGTVYHAMSNFGRGLNGEHPFWNSFKIGLVVQEMLILFSNFSPGGYFFTKGLLQKFRKHQFSLVTTL